MPGRLWDATSQGMVGDRGAEIHYLVSFKPGLGEVLLDVHLRSRDLCHAQPQYLQYRSLENLGNVP